MRGLASTRLQAGIIRILVYHMHYCTDNKKKRNTKYCFHYISYYPKTYVLSTYSYSHYTNISFHMILSDRYNLISWYQGPSLSPLPPSRYFSWSSHLLPSLMLPVVLLQSVDRPSSTASRHGHYHHMSLDGSHFY